MTDLTCGLIDVFADVPLSGNPLAVVEGADGLTDDTMRRIAREFNQAETTFLLKSDRADWKLPRSRPVARRCSGQDIMRWAPGCGSATTANSVPLIRHERSSRRSAATSCRSRWKCGTAVFRDG